jgi:NAD-dependent DNA ligase
MTTLPRDEDGTPRPSLYAGRVHDRQVAELLGLVKGMICDGILSDAEAVALAQWLRANSAVAAKYPGSVIAARLQQAFADGILEEAERHDLEELLREVSGETEDQSGDLNRSTRLPIDHPTPSVFFDGREFCFTGKFAYGSRKRCEGEVSARGGRCAERVTGKTHYLVIGLIGSPAWVQSTHGTKIEHAVALRERGSSLAILSEEQWLEAIQYDAT